MVDSSGVGVARLDNLLPAVTLVCVRGSNGQFDPVSCIALDEMSKKAILTGVHLGSQQKLFAAFMPSQL